MATKISDFYSEYSIKSDKAVVASKKIEKENKKLSKTLGKQSKAFDKNQKELDQSTKKTEKYTKETKQAERATGRFARALKRVTRGARRGASTAGNIAVGGAGGSLFASIGKAIPIAGAAVVAAGVAIEKAASAFSQAAQEQGRRAQFGRATAVDPGLKSTRGALTAEGFASADVEGALGRLSETGISNISKQQLEVIQTEAKRVGTVTQAIENILSGTGFRSLGQSGKNLESIAQNLQFSSQSAQTDFAVITRQLKQLQSTQGSAIESQIKATEKFRIAQTRATALQTVDAQNSIDLSKAVSFETITTFRKVQNDVAIFSANAAENVAKFAKQGVKELQKFVDENPTFEDAAGAIIKKILPSFKFFADGGSTAANESIVVGEKGPEIFTPKKSGTVIPNNKLGGGGGMSIGAINVTVNAGGGDGDSIARTLEQKLPQILNSYANKVLSRQLGLSEGLA